MFAAKVMPTGRSPTAEAHQPTAIITPTAAPVAGHGHLPCSGSRGPRSSQTAPASASAAITIQAGSPVRLARVGAPPSAVASVGFWSSARTGDSTPTPAVVAPIAKPRSTTQAPTAPSPTRYHVLPEQPPERIMPTPKRSPPTMFESQWSGRRGMSTKDSASRTSTPTIATSRARA